MQPVLRILRGRQGILAIGLCQQFHGLFNEFLLAVTYSSLFFIIKAQRYTQCSSLIKTEKTNQL